MPSSHCHPQGLGIHSLWFLTDGCPGVAGPRRTVLCSGMGPCTDSRVPDWDQHAPGRPLACPPSVQRCSARDHSKGIVLSYAGLQSCCGGRGRAGHSFPDIHIQNGGRELAVRQCFEWQDTKPFSGASCKHLTNATSFILVCFCSWQHPWPQPGQWRVRAPSPRRFPASLPALRCLVLFASQGDPNPT